MSKNRDYKEFAAGEYYHVFNRGNDKIDIFRDAEDYLLLLQRLREALYPPVQGHLLQVQKTGERYQRKVFPQKSFSLIAYCLMPNHFHLLISTPGEDLGKAMQTFIASVTRKINLKSGRTGRVFGARYHWSLIGSPNYYDNVLKYVYRNPVKGGLITTVQNYRYSSLGAILENTASWIQPPLGYEMNIPNNRKTEFLNWLNQPFGTEQEIAIKKGFLKPEFHPPKNRSDRKIPDFTGFNSKDALHIQKVSDT